jgi:hypothetical protein
VHAWNEGSTADFPYIALNWERRSFYNSSQHVARRKPTVVGEGSKLEKMLRTPSIPGEVEMTQHDPYLVAALVGQSRIGQCQSFHHREPTVPWGLSQLQENGRALYRRLLLMLLFGCKSDSESASWSHRLS